LSRYTLLFGFSSNKDHAEWITAAFVLGGPAPLAMQVLMAGFRLPREVRLELTMGPERTWLKHRSEMEKFVYPILRMKSELLRAMRQWEEEKS
jgi:hypothetical protein